MKDIEVIQSSILNFVLLSCFLLIVGCASDYDEYLFSPEIQREESYGLTIRDTLNIEVPDFGFPAYQEIRLFGDSVFIGCKGLRFDIYDFKKKTYVRSIQLDDNLFNRVVGFYAHSLDSIFIAEEPREIVLVDNKGAIINRWHMNEEELYPLVNSIDANYFSAFSVPINFYDSKNKALHVSFTCADIWYFEDREKYKLHGVYDLEGEKWISTFGRHPNIYGVSASIKYPFVYSNPYCWVLNEKSFVSFPMDHYVYIFNNLTGELIDKKIVSSKFFRNIPKPQDYSNNDFQAERNFVIETGYYGEFRYHSNVKIFTRIVRHNNKLKNEIGMLSTPQKKETSVLILDKNLNILGEHLFDKNSSIAGVGGDLNLSNGFLTPDGFIGSFKSSFITSDDTLRYQIEFNITEYE